MKLWEFCMKCVQWWYDRAWCVTLTLRMMAWRGVGARGTRPAASEQRVHDLECNCMFSCEGTVVSREQREVCGVPRYRGLAAHVVVVVALRRRRRHEGRRRRQARGPAPGAAREGVHGGERADVAHARGALAAGRLRAARDRYGAPQPRHRARSSIAARPPRLPSARPRAASLCFEFLIYRHSSSTRAAWKEQKNSTMV